MMLTVEFGGGLELLCDSVKIHNVNVDPQNGAEKLTMRDLLAWTKKNLIKERPEMFIKGDTVRPGVLVLINDCDWELTGQLDTTLEEKDVYVSMFGTWEFNVAWAWLIPSLRFSIVHGRPMFSLQKILLSGTILYYAARKVLGDASFIDCMNKIPTK